MQSSLIIISVALLIPLTVVISYHDVRYRRIPNAFVLATLLSGVAINVLANGLGGAYASLAGCLLAFALMLIFHIFGAMGAGDVKLFAAIGAVLGLNLVLPTFFVVVITGGLLAAISMVRAGTVRETMFRVLQIFIGLLPGWQMPRFAATADRRGTIPYGVAITLGSLISLTIFNR